MQNNKENECNNKAIYLLNVSLNNKGAELSLVFIIEIEKSKKRIILYSYYE